MDWLRSGVERIFRRRSRGIHPAPVPPASPPAQVRRRALNQPQSGAGERNGAPDLSAGQDRKLAGSPRQAVVEMGCSVTRRPSTCASTARARAGGGPAGAKNGLRRQPGMGSAGDDRAHRQITAAATYPGCPYCGNRPFARCGECGRVGCSAEGASVFRCPWCGNARQVEEGLDRLHGTTHSSAGAGRTIGSGHHPGPEVPGPRSGRSLSGR